ncbi:hypothetical protein HYC85_027534 [Camellia sinensis]|uniref:Uncharacterized protein n=1 Tax=Camellia sinensis TaxID=4442 RepID=A0A7J7G7Z4_CAMSI|nr:hypothetical protein HYC85_027534 [Camellia sinensis]
MSLIRSPIPSMVSAKLNFLETKKMLSLEPPSSASATASAAVKGRFVQALRCTPLQQFQQKVESGIMCEPCNGTGWLLCDFCEGQKTNVKAANNRIYRRCPSCRAIGYILCSKCKVFKCVTFPNYSDGEDVTF